MPISKIIRTLLMAASIVFGATLWFTRTEEWLPSLSAFAESPNVIWYYLMHGSAATFFLYHGHVTKKWLNYVIGGLMVCILLFTMYAHPFIHNSVTVAALVLSISYLIYSASGFERSVVIFLGALAVTFFLLGYLEITFHFLMAELLAMFMIAVGMARQVWRN